MEYPFHKNEHPYLRTALKQTKTQEQTLEVKLSEGMPDIGRVLLCCGQPVIRSKEWRGDGAVVTGGIMASVLYQPEDGGAPRSVEGWLPFQLKWDFAGAERDGTILVFPWLRNMEARCISARKLMLRAEVAAALQALQPDSLQLYTPDEMPDNVQLLRNTYPLRLPSEAGEKLFLIDEDLQPPLAQMEQILYSSLLPVIHERKVVADKLVFRGSVLFHLAYQSEDGQLHTWEHEIPFSQFCELDREYTSSASATVWMAVTSLELEKGEQTALRLKAGITGQYVIFSEEMVELVEDAYCPGCTMTLQAQQVSIPVATEPVRQSVTAEAPLDGRPLDVYFLPGVAQMTKQENKVVGELLGQFLVLYLDDEGTIQAGSLRWDGGWETDGDPATQTQLILQNTGRYQMTPDSVRTELILEADMSLEEDKCVICGFSVEEAQPDPNRPSLILCKAGDRWLWDVAKENGSTVEMIMQANGLQGQPEPERMLLIPVL